MFKPLLYLLKRHAYIQIILLLFILFVAPLLPDHSQLYSVRIGFYFLVIVSAYLIDRHAKLYVRFSIVLVCFKIISDLLGQDWLMQIDDHLTVLFFMWIALKLIRQTMRKEINDDTILTAISGYLLMAVALTVLMILVLKYDPNGFTYLGNPLTEVQKTAAFCSYYVFITFTTVGYGDIIPVHTLSQTFAKFTAVAGQIYLTINVAILVGKYINKTSSGDKNESGS